jgi:hypothetical protein
MDRALTGEPFSHNMPVLHLTIMLQVTGGKMATLHIEHAIHDLQTWLGAFNGFAEARQKGGVRAYRIYQPVHDDKYILIELDFDTVDQAEGFKRFLELNVWSSPTASPGLASVPSARVLNRVLADT